MIKRSMILCLFILILCTACKTQAEHKAIDGNMLAYTIIEQDSDEKMNKRMYFEYTIVPTVDITTFTPNDFLATAMNMAIEKQKETKAEIVLINMLAQNVGSYGSPQLALVTYIPDQKGITGEEDTEVWDLTAVSRTFTQKELDYLKLWAELRKNYINDMGSLSHEAEERLDTIISAKIGIPANSSRHYANYMQPFEIKEK